jgi:hypothetical protein
MNHELQKKIEEWRKFKKIMENAGLTKEDDYYRKESKNYVNTAIALTPQLIDEVEFLNRVVAGLVDETVAAETIQLLTAENDMMRSVLDRISKKSVTGRNVVQACTEMQGLALDTLLVLGPKK